VPSAGRMTLTGLPDHRGRSRWEDRPRNGHRAAEARDRDGTGRPAVANRKRVRRVMREHGLLVPQRRIPRSEHTGRVETERSDQGGRGTSRRSRQPRPSDQRRSPWIDDYRIQRPHQSLACPRAARSAACPSRSADLNSIDDVGLAALARQAARSVHQRLSKDRRLARTVRSAFARPVAASTAPAVCDLLVRVRSNPDRLNRPSLELRTDRR
jgi:hypothetical protein